MMMRRLLSLLAASLLASMASCGGSDTGTQTTTAGIATNRFLPLVAVVLMASVTSCGAGEQEAAPTTTVAPTATVAPTTAVEERAEIVVERGLAYATFQGITLTLDLYIPADPKGAPIMVEPWETFGDNISQAGAFAVIEQQGIPDQPDSADGEPPFWDDHGALIRAHAEAIACKIRYARARAAELGSDDPIVVLGGFSAGGGIAAHVALFGATLEQRWDDFATSVGGPSRQVECLVTEGSTHADALVVGNGTYDAFVPVIEGPFGRTYVLERAPELQPFLASAVGIDPSLRVRLMSATGDNVVPTSFAVAFEQVLADAGYDVRVVTYEGVHTSDPPDELSFEVFTELLGL